MPTPGPFDSKHGYLQWGGSLPGNEQWSCGLRLAASAGSVSGPLSPAGRTTAANGWDIEELLDHYTSKVQAMHVDEYLFISSRVKLNFVKFNRINVEGHYDEPMTHQRIFADIAGSTPGPFGPNQVSLAVSWTTAFSRGPAHRGRIYLPPTCIVPADDGLIGTGEADSVRDRMRAFLEAVADVPGLDTIDDPTPSVMSRVLGRPACNPITGVAVGRVLDTQRKRRRSLKEQYESVAVDFGTF